MYPILSLGQQFQLNIMYTVQYRIEDKNMIHAYLESTENLSLCLKCKFDVHRNFVPQLTHMLCECSRQSTYKASHY